MPFEPTEYPLKSATSGWQCCVLDISLWLRSSGFGTFAKNVQSHEHLVLGAVGCFWIGVLGRIILGPLPVPVSTLGWWAAASVAIGVVLGVLFPKVVCCVCFPFSTIG